MMNRTSGISNTAPSSPSSIVPDFALREVILVARGLAPDHVLTEKDIAGLLDLDLTDAKWISSLEGLQHAINLRRLKLDLREFALDALRPIEFDILGGLPSLRELSILGYGTDLPTGLAAHIATMPNLRGLHIKHIPNLDLEFLSSAQRLSSVWLFGCHLSDISPLTSMSRLKILGLNCSIVSDFAPLAALTGLVELSLHGTSFSDLRLLSNMSLLRNLRLSETQVTDIGPLSANTALYSLDISTTRILDFSPLSYLTRLNNLQVSGTLLTDLHWLDSTRNLQVLDATRTCVSDIEPLRKHSKLYHLSLDDHLIHDFSPLAALKKSLIVHIGKRTLFGIGEVMSFLAVRWHIQRNLP